MTPRRARVVVTAALDLMPKTLDEMRPGELADAYEGVGELINEGKLESTLERVILHPGKRAKAAAELRGLIDMCNKVAEDAM